MKDKINDCFNLFFIIVLLSLFLDISGIKEVLRARTKNEGIVSNAKT